MWCLMMSTGKILVFLHVAPSALFYCLEVDMPKFDALPTFTQAAAQTECCSVWAALTNKLSKSMQLW